MRPLFTTSMVYRLAESGGNVEFQFGTEPLEERRLVYELLSQETRFYVLQVILGHPEHLVSLAEFDYLVPKSKPAIRDQLETLSESDVITDYPHPPNESNREYPSTFWGPTEPGLELLYEFNFLRQTPVLRALYDVIRLDSTRQRHLDAPRPSLPATVAETLSFDEDEADSVDPEEVLERFANDEGVELNGDDSIISASTKTAPAESRDGTPLDELF